MSAYNAGEPDSIPGSGRSPGEGNATHSSILVWRIPWTEEPGGLQSMGVTKSRTQLSDFTHWLFSCGTWGLPSLSWCESSLVVASELLVVACKFLVVACKFLVVAFWFPDQKWNLGFLHWDRGVLATGQPGRSLNYAVRVTLRPHLSLTMGSPNLLSISRLLLF